MITLKNKILFNAYYFLLWIGYFIFSRLFFLVYNSQETAEIGFENAIKTFSYGLKLDISFASYLCILPFIFVIFTVFFSVKKIAFMIKTYTLFVLLFITLLLIIDAGLYQSWGVRIDATLLTYINTPGVMLASISSFQLGALVVSWILISTIFIFIFNKTIDKKLQKIKTENPYQIPIFLLIIAFLIIPIRGGLQTIPINQSNVYFSNQMFANHASINFIWNFFNDITKRTGDKNPYKLLDKNLAEDLIQKTRGSLLTTSKDSILNTSKPNIILIIWESLTAKLVGPLGGEPTVTENLNRLSKEGVLFTNFYANGDRTDKGIPAILSGYYPQPTASIMKMPNKTRSLPFLPQKMIDLGYKTSFYYGGDLNFGNMNTYLRNGGVTNFVDGNDFDKKDWNSKWGVHDHVFMERFTQDLLPPQTEPFFKIALTLSSHEPFEFPKTYKFGKDSKENKLRSAHAYTDKTIGKFIESAKKQAWYKNTLIVIMADHGHIAPKHQGPFNSSKKFHIPMLWLGGALNKTNITIDHFSSQIDFSYTLLNLLQADNSDFKWGKNIFANAKNQYAHYIFNKGFGIINKNGAVVYDFVSNQPILKTGTSAQKLNSLGKAITQKAYQDFLDRK